MKGGAFLLGPAFVRRIQGDSAKNIKYNHETLASCLFVQVSRWGEFLIFFRFLIAPPPSCITTNVDIPPSANTSGAAVVRLSGSLRHDSPGCSESHPADVSQQKASAPRFNGRLINKP